MTKFEWFIASRYLRAKRNERFISVVSSFALIGICLGVATLIIVLSVMNGFREELLGRILGINGHIHVVSTSGFIDTNPNILKKIKDYNHVDQAAWVIEGQALAQHRGYSSGVMIRGMEQKSFIQLPSMKLIQAQENHLSNEGITIGDRLANNLRAVSGDAITLVSPAGAVTAFGTIPRSKEYKVLNEFNVGMYEYDSNFIFMDINEAQGFFNILNKAQRIDVWLNDINDVEIAVTDLKKILGTGFHIYDWKALNGSLVQALQVERNVMFLILTLIIIVAAFNIITSQIMLGQEKNAAVAILRAMGATQRSILKIFMITGSLLGSLGALLGAVVGYFFVDNIELIRQALEKMLGTNLFAAEIYYLSTLPAIFRWQEALFVVAMALVLSFLAAIYPAWKISRKDPVTILRYE